MVAASAVVVTSRSGSSSASGAGDKTSASVARAKSAANRAWLALETVIALLTTGQNTALLLEVGHANSWESGSGVVLGSVVVNLMNRDCGVNDVGLDGLLVDHRLNGLVDVVVNVLTSNGGSNGRGVPGLALDSLVAELGSLQLQALSNLPVVAMLKGAMLNGSKVVVVLLWEDLGIGDGLDGGVVVVLVDLLVNGGGDLLVTLTVDCLVSDGWSNTLVDT